MERLYAVMFLVMFMVYVFAYVHLRKKLERTRKIKRAGVKIRRSAQFSTNFVLSAIFYPFYFSVLAIYIKIFYSYFADYHNNINIVLHFTFAAMYFTLLFFVLYFAVIGETIVNRKFIIRKSIIRTIVIRWEQVTQSHLTDGSRSYVKTKTAKINLSDDAMDRARAVRRYARCRLRSVRHDRRL